MNLLRDQKYAFLLRIKLPITSHINLQSGMFDAAERLIYGINDSREMIFEFYFQYVFLVINNVIVNERVSDVNLDIHRQKLKRSAYT